AAPRPTSRGRSRSCPRGRFASRPRWGSSASAGRSLPRGSRFPSASGPRMTLGCPAAPRGARPGRPVGGALDVRGAVGPAGGLAFLLLALGACATPKASVFVLLPDAEGRTGQITV